MQVPHRLISQGERKFKSLVSDLMVMENPSMSIECPSAAKARSLRRMFYSWRENLAEMEYNFMVNFEFKLIGRTVGILPKANWQPKEVSPGVPNVSPESEST